MKNQKTFIFNLLTLVLTLAVGVLASCTTQTKKAETAEEVVEVAPKELGVQIYSAREPLQADFTGTLQKIVDIGYANIEAFGLGTDGTIYGMSPARYKEITDSLGLKIISVHSTYFTPDQADTMIAAAKTLGAKYVIIPWLNPDMRTDYMAIAANLNLLGEKFIGSGIKIGYHNHDFEFELTPEGKVPEEILIENTDPDLVTFQADLYWVKKGGVNPMDLINKYPGRFSLFHVKDSDDSLNQTTVGTGIIDFQTILKAKDLSGWEYYFVEDERTEDPIGNLKGAFDYLQELEY